VADFVGREPLLRALEARLIDGGASDGVPIVAFFGPPGVGKSALAVHLAHRIRQRFPDGQIYVDLDEPAHRGDPRSGLDDVLASLGIDVPQVTGRPSGGASVFRSWSADRRVLVVLDNAPDTEAVMPYLPTGDGSAVVVTSRHVLFGLGGARFAEVPPLGHADTVALLSALLGLVCTAGEERDLARIAELCEGLPRLATAVAAYVAGHRGHRLSDVADGLVDNRNTLWRSAATRVADTFGDELAELIIDDMPGDGSGAPAAHSMTSWPAR
jgi:DNA polymerase III delta prime subunit